MKYISIFIILQFCIQVLNLEYHLSSKKRVWYIYNSNSISLIIFQDFYSLWLINKIVCSFSYIYKLLNYKMSIFKDMIRENKLQFLNDNYCFYNNHEFKISKWKKMIKNIHWKTKYILNK